MLAIIIPYYKFAFFEATLQSLANQTDKRFKVYIGDDASPENPSTLLNKYQGHFDFVYHRFETNLGGTSLTQQWERCIALTKNEEWLMILGDDDVLGGNVVEEFNIQYENFNKFSDVVRFATIVKDERDLVTKEQLFNHPELEFGLEYFIRKLKRETRSSMSELVFKRKVYLEYKFVNYPLAFYSDDMAWINFSNFKQIYTINKAIIYIRISNFSVTGNDKSNALQKAELAFLKDIYFKYFKYLSKENKLIFLRHLEISFYKNEIKNIFYWANIYFSYLKNFDKNIFLNFNKRLIKKMIFYV